ncbi:MAG: ATP-binding protein, partial [Microcoleaceae cyanobacterium]
IPAEDLDHLFQRGYRGAQAKGNIPGTGLGLAITQDLIQQMDGDIWIVSPLSRQWVPEDFPESSPTLLGTTVTIWLRMNVES